MTQSSLNQNTSQNSQFTNFALPQTQKRIINFFHKLKKKSPPKPGPGRRTPGPAHQSGPLLGYDFKLR